LRPAGALAKPAGACTILEIGFGHLVAMPGVGGSLANRETRSLPAAGEAG
jgi:hypothetical protein